MEFRTGKVSEIQRLMIKELEKLYPLEEAFAITNSLFMHYLGLSRAWVIMEKDRILSESELLPFQRALKRLLNHEPLQYITGKAYFYGLEFNVDHNVLIPRPETEELIKWVLSEVSGAEGNLKILDVGTGSGCIAITIKKELEQAEVYAVDISSEVLDVASDNASINNVSVHLNRLDILDKVSRNTLPVFDVIISNPPYVTPSDKDKMRLNVTDHEPDLALFVKEEDPLIFYREIIHFAKDHLSPGGRLFFECNESNAGEVALMMKADGYSKIELRKDMQGKERMVMGFGF